MLSKAKIKFIKSLQVKKYRKQEQCFVVQGAKGVEEALASDFAVTLVIGTDDFLAGLKTIKDQAEVIRVKEKELEELGEFQSNNAALAVVRMKPNEPFQLSENEFAIMLDDISDPGNLGTIIRTADWYGITKIVASTETADFYNPKVISATMGSFTRVSVFYTDLVGYLSNSSSTVFGAFLNGQDVHQVDFGRGGIILIGNESRGIDPALDKFVSKRITIPKYGGAESLNAGVATAVICDNLRRV